jgi:hypothetical protein
MVEFIALAKANPQLNYGPPAPAASITWRSNLNVRAGINIVHVLTAARRRDQDLLAQHQQ